MGRYTGGQKNSAGGIRKQTPAFCFRGGNVAKVIEEETGNLSSLTYRPVAINKVLANRKRANENRLHFFSAIA